MIGNFGKLKIEIFGESHSQFIGVRLGGVPSGMAVSDVAIKAMLNRRKSSADVWSTPRHEDDNYEILSGIKNQITTGEIIEVVIKNIDANASNYLAISSCPRPSHADYVAYLKDGCITSGGGRFSGRMTAPLCIAGAIAEEILKANGIDVYAYVSSVGNVELGSYKNCVLTKTALKATKTAGLNTISGKSVLTAQDFTAQETLAQDLTAQKTMAQDLTKQETMAQDLAEQNSENTKNNLIKTAQDLIKSVAASGDSVGGSVECVCQGLPAGKLGDALFEGLESKISYSIFAVPAVKGVEFGSGFALSHMFGSEANDAFKIENGVVSTVSNHNGGINGGIANGMPLTLRVAIKPTPSISKPQQTVDLEKNVKTEISIRGRHDACIVPRAVPCIESAVALAILDEMLLENQI